MPFDGGPITNVEGVTSSSTIEVLDVAPGTLPEKVALVLRSEVIAERRQFFTAIPKERSDGHNRAGNEDEGANDQQDNRMVGHSVFLC
jgi:hypothetical protein